MKLKDILTDNKLYIEYRTNSPLDEDILSGSCYWDGKELHPIDRDIYSVDDVITRYQIENERNLIVWYESKWI